MKTDNKKFIFCAAGIFVSYFVFGVLQEKITRSTYTYEIYNKDGTKSIINEKFTFALTIVFVQCIINFLVAKVALHLWPAPVEDKTKTVYYASVSVTYLLAMVCSNMALQWVPYPTQVIGKSAKPIPVMCLGVLLGNKSYPTRKYFFVLLIVIGIVVFMIKDKYGASSQDAAIGIGELLLLLSLLMDGLTGAIQERMRSEAKPTGLQMMKTSNAWSAIYLIISLLITGEVFTFVTFANRHLYLYYNLLLLGLTSSIGQLFLYSMVSDFGPLAVSIVTTTRKFFTVLGSVILFGNVIGMRQWIGAVMVFAGLFLDAYYSKSKAVGTNQKK